MLNDAAVDALIDPPLPWPRKRRGNPGDHAMTDEQLGRAALASATGLPFLWFRDRRGYLCRRAGPLTLQVFPKPPEGQERWGDRWMFKVRADGQKPYRSRATYATEAEAVRHCILYVLAGITPNDDAEPDYED
jgi:hypothetical protein